MRFSFLFLFILICPLASGSESISHCAGIEDATARLQCYDNITAGPNEPEDKTEKRAPVPVAPTEVPRDVVEQKESPAPTPRKQKPPEDYTAEAQEDFGITLFGKGSDVEAGERITSRIETIRLGSGGHRIMTLENGQVWMEREPGRRRIDVNQDIEIVKRRWSHSMSLLEQNRRVTVQRID